MSPFVSIYVNTVFSLLNYLTNCNQLFTLKYMLMWYNTYTHTHTRTHTHTTHTHTCTHTHAHTHTHTHTHTYTQEVQPLGAIVLRNYTVSKVSDMRKPFSFKIVKGGARSYYFCADSEQEMNKWAQVLTEGATLEGRVSRVHFTIKEAIYPSQSMYVHFGQHEAVA